MSILLAAIHTERMDNMNTKTRYQTRLHGLEIALLLVMGVFLLSGAVTVKAQSSLAEGVVRLHVLANSDSEADQALKLTVRDAVLAETEGLLDGAAGREEAAGILRAQLPLLQRAAERTLAEQGSAYSVEVRLENAEFPTKAYDGFALPAGEYLALRVLIGEAKGQNWWCVVFPPLCTAAVSEMPEVAVSAGLSGSQVRLITEEDGYVLKFKCAELWQQLRTALGK